MYICTRSGVPAVCVQGQKRRVLRRQMRIMYFILTASLSLAIYYICICVLLQRVLELEKKEIEGR